MFNENSGLVKVWVSLVRSGDYTEAQVPALGNLQEAVHNVLTREGTAS